MSELTESVFNKGIEKGIEKRMNNTITNILNKTLACLYSKKLRSAVFWILTVCTLAVFLPAALFEGYRVCVIHVFETLVAHRTLRNYDKWHKVLLSFGLRGCVFVLLTKVLCKKDYQVFKAICRGVCRAIKALVKGIINSNRIVLIAPAALYALLIVFHFLSKNNVCIFISSTLRPMLFVCGAFLAWSYGKDSRTAAENNADRADRAMIVFLGVFAFITALLSINGGQDWGGDWSEYVAQARAICEGKVAEQVRNNTFIIKNSTPVGPDVYPWGFPLLMSPVYALFGKNLFALKMPCVLCFAVFAIYFYRLIRRSFGVFASFIIAMCFVINGRISGYANSLLSDMPFLCMSTVAIYYIIALFDAKSGGRGGGKMRFTRRHIYILGK